MRWRCKAAALLAMAGAALCAQERVENRPSAISLRKRLHVNPLITEPDTLDFEFGGDFSTAGGFTFPTAIRFTPEGRHTYWGRTEFSLVFDSVNSDTQDGRRTTHFGDRITMAANYVLFDGEKLDLAFAPQSSVLLRGDSGLRLGGTAIARYDAGRSSTGVTVGWTGATSASNSNPAGVLDVGAGFGFRLKPSGALGHLTPHTNILYEKATGLTRQISIFEGMEYQVTDAFALDVSVQHVALWGGQTDHQISIGMTVSTPHLHRNRDPGALPSPTPVGK
jgi:hypothetical protein